MGVPFTMDALAAMSSDEEEEEDRRRRTGRGERSVVVTKRREIDYEALERGGFRARALVDGARDDGGASVGPTTWGKGIAGGRREAYTAEESAATRRAVGEGLTETCAEAPRARGSDAARAESEEERRLERAKSRERHLETKRALREDDRAKRAREAEARVNGERSTPKSRRQKVDLSTRARGGGGRRRERRGRRDARRHGWIRFRRLSARVV